MSVNGDAAYNATASRACGALVIRCARKKSGRTANATINGFTKFENPTATPIANSSVKPGG